MGDTPAAAADPRLAQALAAIRGLRARVEDLDRARAEGIAIVGIGCRLPGGATSPEAFWHMLANGVDAITEVPSSRWDVESFYDPDPSVPGRMPMRRGAFIDGVDEFDPYFFGISPREAERMDPQQRLFLEVAWEALENAGQTRNALTGSATGVFVGANASDYLHLQLADPAHIDMHTIVGSANCIIPNRLSYLLDLRGPSLTVDTACSSSLVAVHLASQALRTRECDAAVVGGMNLIISPATTMAHAKGLPLAPDGRCKTFDARADGYSRGEGVAVVVLKRLSDALTAGDPIWAVIRGSAVNQDGLTNGLTAPNGLAQRDVIRRALKAARVDPAQVSLLESHGTGTALGDPIEVESLNDVYGTGGTDDNGCALGSVKTNVGHLEAGAGIVGLVKTALSIRHRAIPPNLHFESLNPHISLDDSRLFVPTSLLPWDGPGERRYGAVSSFGAGGTNAHVILGPGPDSAPADARPVTGGQDGAQAEPCVIPISARSADALTSMVRAYRDHLGSPAGRSERLADIGYSATVRRTRHEHRCAVVASSHEQAVARLSDWLDAKAPAGVVAGHTSAAVVRGVVFVFPGQGPQRAGMGRELMQRCPAFATAVTECDQAMRQWLGRSILHEIEHLREGSDIDVIQPALFAVAVGLAARWRSLGLRPDAVIGHSMGEVAAAHVAGALTLEDATRIICRRSALLRRIRGQGAMLVVALPGDEAEKIVRDRRDRVSVAVSNSPTSTVLSGDPGALTELAATLRGRNVFCRPVRVDVASHSPQVDCLRDDLLVELSGVKPQASDIPILSTVTGELCDGSTFTADYWVRNLRAPVRFWDGVLSLIAAGHGVFAELSPHPTLLGAVEQGFEVADREGLALASIRRDEPETCATLEGVAALHSNGFPIPLDSLTPGGRVVSLPAYTWQHERFWFDAGSKQKAPAATVPAPRTDTDTVPAPGSREPLQALVTGAVAGVLHLATDRVDPRMGFFQMGMDSMLAAQARRRIEAALQRKLPATVMFEHASVQALAEHLVGLSPHPGSPSGGPAESGQETESSQTDQRSDQPVDHLSEEELLGVLVDELRTSGVETGGIL